MAENGITPPNPDTVREFRRRIRRLTRTRGTNDYVVEEEGVKKVVTVSRFRATFIEEYDSWSSLIRDRQPKEAAPSTGGSTFDFTELSSRKPVGRGKENTLHKKSGVLYKKLFSPILVPVTTEVQSPTEEDFHHYLVILSQANWKNKLSRKKETTWDERRSRRRALRKS